MSNIHTIDPKSSAVREDRRLDEASDWIAKLDRQLSEQEKLSFQQWLAADSKNESVLAEIALMWDKMDDLARLSDLFPQHIVNNNKRANWMQVMAASVLVVLSVGLYQVVNDILPSSNNPQPEVVAVQASYQTSVGESTTIHLPDNSKLVLNTNSFVQVKYTRTARIIELQRGELHIDVAHDKARPLSVLAQGKVIQAVGTAFNVEVRSKLVELIVTEGKVLVAQQTKQNMNPQSDKALKLPVSSMAIAKGEKVNLNSTDTSKDKVVKVDQSEITARLSWRSGNLIFRGESLVEAMAEISRYTNIEFELSDDEHLKNVQVAGMFKTGDVTGLLEILDQNFNISHEKVTNDKILLSYSGS